jgi:hypothetical protein
MNDQNPYVAPNGSPRAVTRDRGHHGKFAVVFGVLACLNIAIGMVISENATTLHLIVAPVMGFMAGLHLSALAVRRFGIDSFSEWNREIDSGPADLDRTMTPE